MCTLLSVCVIVCGVGSAFVCVRVCMKCSKVNLMSRWAPQFLPSVLMSCYYCLLLWAQTDWDVTADIRYRERTHMHPQRQRRCAHTHASGPGGKTHSGSVTQAFTTGKDRRVNADAVACMAVLDAFELQHDICWPLQHTELDKSRKKYF